jgi:alpha-D-ribose 1-methylphosphonate 5-triphosphate synthase subunit PhnH
MRAGLAEPVADGVRIFRVVLDAMAHPGRILAVPATAEAPPPLHAAAAALCLTLVDFETPLWVDGMAATPEAVEYLRFHCGCAFVGEPARARFGLVADPRRMPGFEAFALGTDEYPDRSATLIIQVEALRPVAGRHLAGPGIERQADLDVRGVPESFWAEVQRNHSRFPRGVDLILAAPDVIAALPRTTRVTG